MIVRDLTAADAALLQQLADQHPFKPYRHHRFLSRPRQAAVLLAEVDRVRKAAPGLGLLGEAGESVALVTGRVLDWDSSFFGVTMGRIEHVLRIGSASRRALEATLHDALRRLRGAGVRHVSMKIDVADQDAIAIAEDAGFRLMDALNTYIAHPRRPPPRPLKPVGVIRPFRSADTEQVMEVTREAYQDYKGRFQLDPHLSREKSDQFYLEWARNCCAGTMADRMFVAEDSAGRIIGWASVKRAEPVSTVGGAPISVGSLGACRPDSVGAYGGLICAAAVENHAAGILTEAMTQNSNFAMVRILEAVGAQYARAEYTFHAWFE